MLVAAAQPPCVPLDVAANAAAHAAAVRAAAAALVVFPELSLTGYELAAAPVGLHDPVLGPLVDACAATATTVLAGAITDEDGRRSIAVLRVDAGGVTIAYRKVHLGGDEPDHVASGDGPVALQLAGRRTGVLVCRDTAFPEATAALGVALVVAGVVHRPGELAEQERRTARIARLARAPVVLASAAGPAGAAYPATAGHSTVLAADGTVLARAGAAPGELAIADV